MCRANSEGGRRCTSSHLTGDALTAHNERRRQQRTARRDVADQAREHPDHGEYVAGLIMAFPPGKALTYAANCGLVPESERGTSDDYVARASLLPSDDMVRCRWSLYDEEGDLVDTPHCDRDQVIAEARPWVESLTADEREAMENYTASANGTVNAALRMYGGDLDEVVAQHPDLVPMITRLDSALARSGTEKDQVVYRALTPALRGGETVQGWASRTYDVGATVEMDAYTSTTHNPQVAAGLAANDATGQVEVHGVVYEIVTRRGAYVGEVSLFGTEEEERLLPRGTRCQVVGVKQVEYEFGVFHDETGTATLTVVQMVDVTDDAQAMQDDQVAA